MARQTKQKQKRKGKVNTGKAVLYFIEQKILEIIGIGLLVLLLAGLKYISNLELINKIGEVIALILIISVFIAGAYVFIKENWEWAKKRASK